MKPPTVTHMNARVLDHVRFSTGSGTSTTASCGNDTGIFQIALDGATSSPFIVPPGRALVITDVSFGARARQDYPWTVGTLVSVDFRVSGANRRLWQSTTVVDAAMAAGQALWGKEQILSGVVVGPGQTVCLRAGLGFEAQNGQASFINLSKLYGYLVDL